MQKMRNMSKDNTKKAFYRYETIQYASIGYDGEYENSPFPNPRLILYTFYLHKETPKGYWIGHGASESRWVSKTAKKRFAYPTKQEAINNFIKRNERRIAILNNQLTSCKMALVLAKNEKI